MRPRPRPSHPCWHPAMLPCRVRRPRQAWILPQFAHREKQSARRGDADACTCCIPFFPFTRTLPLQGPQQGSPTHVFDRARLLRAIFGRARFGAWRGVAGKLRTDDRFGRRSTAGVTEVYVATRRRGCSSEKILCTKQRSALKRRFFP
jgi:hypothetical protein